MMGSNAKVHLVFEIYAYLNRRDTKAAEVFRHESECAKDTYRFGVECSACNSAFETLQASVI